MTASPAAVVLPPGEIRVAPPLTLYIHLPWCGKRCPYCDFNAHLAPAALPEILYLEAVVRDLESALPAVWGRRLTAVFIGGGTPSLFAPESIEFLLMKVRALFNLSPEVEVTLEANPDSADAVKFGEFAAAGVNRLSVGAQSFDNAALTRLSRLHDGNSARRAVEAACKAVENVNVDLMHALPQQTAAAAAADVRAAADFAPAHLSLYQLTLEPGTPFHRQPPQHLPDDDTGADIAAAVANAADAAGYRRYEISAYARPHRRCAHNLNYWRFGDYLGVGAGAHGKITINGKIFRERRVNHPLEYMRRANTNANAGNDAGGAVAERRRLTAADAVFEFLLNALRLCDGFDLAMLRERAGALPAATERALQQAEQDGLICFDDGVLRPSALGLSHLNALLMTLLPEAPTAAANDDDRRQSAF